MSVCVATSAVTWDTSTVLTSVCVYFTSFKCFFSFSWSAFEVARSHPNPECVQDFPMLFRQAITVLLPVIPKSKWSDAKELPTPCVASTAQTLQIPT